MIVRRYEPRDRAAVREICCETADSGQPVERFFPDREVFADLLTRYYTDFAPEATWVADDENRVVGYLTGCLDTGRYLRAMAFRIAPLAFLRALARGTLWHRQTRQLISANIGDWLRGRRRQELSEYPAHVHINLRAGVRGQGIGERLMEQFFRQAKSAGVSGVYANVGESNEGGRRFFESCGFRVIGRENRLRFPDAPGEPTFTLIYAVKL